MARSRRPRLRVTVDGWASTKDYLRVTITEDRKAPLSWTRVPLEA